MPARRPAFYLRQADRKRGHGRSSEGVPASHNFPEYSVSEISQALKRTVETTYDNVRVKGEISGFKRHSSGHLYFALKDSEAVLDAVSWRGSAGRLSIQPEDGMEVVATGRLTTYPGRSKYQMVVERLELAGQGALLKLLEDRKRGWPPRDCSRRRASGRSPFCRT